MCRRRIASILTIPLALAAAATLVAAPPRAARAQGISPVTTPLALGADDAIDWGQLGTDRTTLSSPQIVTSTGGVFGTVSTTDSAGLLRLDQGTSWDGNFSPGDHLISSATASYFPLTIDFFTPVYGAGANIEQDLRQPFTASITAYAGSTVLGTFTENGLSTSGGDGSAIFLGVLGTSPQITRIVFGIVSPASTQGDFAINTLQLATSASIPLTAPDPGTLWLLSLGLALLAVRLSSSCAGRPGRRCG